MIKIWHSRKKQKAGFTDGRQVEDINARVLWRRSNLDGHYTKHPAGVDKDCWADLVGRPGEQATKHEYEQASYESVEHAAIHYTCVDVGRGDEAPRQHFLDERFIETVTPMESKDDKLEIITCFHRHNGGPKNHESIANQPSLRARTRTLVDKLDKLKAAKILVDLDIKKPRDP